MKARVLAGAMVAGLASAAGAQMVPEWIATQSLGASLSAGMTGMVTDAAGNTYITGTGGSSSNTDVVTTAFGPDGSLLWSKAFNGPANWHDQARGIALGPGGTVYVCGNTPGPGSYANVLVLKYSASSGELLQTIQFSNGPGLSESAGSIVVDAAANVYVGGGTVGDGGDCLTIKFNPAGAVEWQKVWDGPAWAPYSQDYVRGLALAPDGNLVMMTDGVMSSLHPDYVVIKYDAADGRVIWENKWGVNGGDFPAEIVVDAAGDIYVTGIGIDFIDKYSTVKFRGSDGQIQWQQYDAVGNDHSAWGIALDGQGGVYVTGTEDPDGNHSNFNDNFFTVKRDAATGAFVWQHRYGANCVGCYDVARDVAVDSAGNLIVVGSSSTAPYTADLLLFRLDPATGLEIERGTTGGGANESAAGSIMRFDALRNLYVGGGFSNANTGAITAAVMKFAGPGAVGCYANCDRSSAAPVLNVNDFTCFLNRYAAGEGWANCDGSSAAPVLNVNDFTCFLNLFASGCP